MLKLIRYGMAVLPLFLLLFGLAPVEARLLVQCPGDTNGDLVPDKPGYENVVCMHLTAGDGFARMADGTSLYMFSYGKVDPLKTPLEKVIADYSLKATNPAPLIKLKEGQELYLTLTNVGMMKRPDLFDAHSVHWHGLPNAMAVFDGIPELSPAPVIGSSYTYYYKAALPGTYFYHCHVEAVEHMQMGMIGNLWIEPAQNGTSKSYGGRTYTKFAYNDGDGSTGYDRAYPVQFTGYDSKFHTAHINVQPLPFASMDDDYFMINGRGYPDVINTSDTAITNVDNFKSQPDHTLITANQGERILLRVSNVITTDLLSFATTLGIPMKVVGRGAELLRSPDGVDTSYETSVLNVAGGESYEVMLDTGNVAPGTYFLYSTNLHFMSNGPQDKGGALTEIVIGNGFPPQN